MIHIRDNFDLSTYNTFGIPCKTKRFFEFTESEELLQLLENDGLPEKYFVLGGGSNLLFQKDFDGLILHPNIPGVVERDEDRNHVYLEAGAGTNWDELVYRSVVYELGGLENLSLIPGHVGAVPIQNIGAYGVEAKDRVALVRGIDLEKKSRVEFTNEECEFAYRDSVFKRKLKNKVVITSVVFRLEKFPEFNLDYGALRAEVAKQGEPSLHSVRKAVINIRESKLPDPEKLGNAGSFFKNPVVDERVANQLSEKYANMPRYSVADEGKVKLAAGWLIDRCGLKGLRKGQTGIHDKQALVIVNYGKASGREIAAMAQQVQETVYDKFQIKLEPEVTYVL